ncbi:histidinol-phosphate transaminase [Roseibium sp.]|uniref:histidinol-phosphate transaminase n=1 Tax=Roseibium sp. TaxID=1936156 RepID=UPI001B1F5931|nr:histidinol-phosphate transaminase [Roseibium sp.]MBO6855413.1 histidinol-phosphate transaminase [Roseibium sp.]
MSRFWSPIVSKLVPYTPGEQPKDRSFIKLNTNEHPYGPSPIALGAIRAATEDSLRLYPDPSAGALRATIGASFGLGVDHVFAGNGSDEVLAHAFHGFFSGKDKLLFPDITYSFYKTYCELYGISHRSVPLDDDFRIDPASLGGPCGGIVLANPNAPTGIALDLAAVRSVLERNPNVVVLVDEAYVDFGAESAARLVPEFDNLLVVQTFSKSRGLAGLRVGFALGQPHLIEGLQRIKDSFNSYPLDRLALAGAEASWQDTAWFEETRRLVITERHRMAEGLRSLGFNVLPSAANFLFVSHETRAARDLLTGLRDEGILVRHFNKDRIDNWLRISIGTEEEGEALLKVMAGLVAG